MAPLLIRVNAPRLYPDSRSSSTLSNSLVRIPFQHGRARVQPCGRGIRRPALRRRLPAPQEPCGRRGRRAARPHEGVCGARVVLAALGGLHVALPRALERLYRRAAPAPPPARPEIGRASCRERGCTWEWGVAAQERRD